MDRDDDFTGLRRHLSSLTLGAKMDEEDKFSPNDENRSTFSNKMAPGFGIPTPSLLGSSGVGLGNQANARLKRSKSAYDAWEQPSSSSGFGSSVWEIGRAHV